GRRVGEQDLRRHSGRARQGRSGGVVASFLWRTFMNMSLILRLRALAGHDEGQDLIEYALLVGLISLVAVAAVTLAGGSVNQIFDVGQAALSKAAAAA